MNLSGRVQYGGVVVALSAFGVTRLFVVEAIRIDVALPFLVAGLVPLVLGLALTVYGVALALGPFTDRYVKTVARWHVLGIGSMLVVFAITGLNEVLRGMGFTLGNRDTLLVANVLLGGAIGGTLTGIRSGKTLKQRREIKRSANQALLVNRLLKHVVLNAATIVDGYAQTIEDGDDDTNDSVDAIREAVGRIQSTVEEVGTMAEPGDRSGRVDAEVILREEIEALGADDVTITIHADDTDVAVDERLGIVVGELLENAIVHGGDTDVSIELRETAHSLELSVVDEGPGLPTAQRALLESGEFPEFDDPTAGFGLQIVRLLVVQFGGDIVVQPVTDEGTGTRITIVLPRGGRGRMSAETVGLSFPSLTHAIIGGLLGGIAMGLFYTVTTGLLPVIGSLYGIKSPLIGWITHLFHSAVFGLLFAAIYAVPRIDEAVSGPIRFGLLGLGWGTVLWLVGAGIIMPAWLGLISVGPGTPTYTLTGLVGHWLWGVVLGITYWGAREADVTRRLQYRFGQTKQFTGGLPIVGSDE